MFEDVAQMEKEIETFRKNIVASSELVEGIAGLTEATRLHKESYVAATAELLRKIDDSIIAIKADHEAALLTLSGNNDAAITSFQKNMAEEQATRMAELQHIKSALESLQASYAERLQQTECAIREYQGKLSDCVGQIKADHEATLKALSERVDAAISDVQKKSADDLAARIKEINGIRAAIEENQAQTTKKTDEQIQRLIRECERLIAEMKSELASQQAAYSERTHQTEQAIREYQNDAEKKYKEFVNRLETTNVDQIYKEIQDLKKSIQMKFMILMGGIGVAMVVSVIGLILK